MELFSKLFGTLLVFVYHCFERIVIHGYLSGLLRPAQVVHFFRQVVGVAAVDKATLSQRTQSRGELCPRIRSVSASRRPKRRQQTPVLDNGKDPKPSQSEQGATVRRPDQ